MFYLLVNLVIAVVYIKGTSIIENIQYTLSCNIVYGIRAQDPKEPLVASSPSFVSSQTILSSSSLTLSHPVFKVNNIKSFIPINLDQDNFLLWQTLFITVLNGHQVLDHVDGSSTPRIIVIVFYLL